MFRRKRLTSWLPSVPVDENAISVIRLTLVLAALLATFVVPEAWGAKLPMARLALVAYAVYAGLVNSFLSRGGRLLPEEWLPWMDVGWASLVLALSGGQGPLYPLFFIFCVLIAAFRWGYRTGVRVGLTALLLYLIIVGGSLTRWPAERPIFEMRLFILLFLGGLITFWGGREYEQRRRLNLMHEITRVSNPRFGLEHVLRSVVDQTRRHFEASACLWVMNPSSQEEYHCYRSCVHSPQGQDGPIPFAVARQLLLLPDTVAIRCHPSRNGALHCHATDVETHLPITVEQVYAALPRRDTGRFLMALRPRPLGWRIRRAHLSFGRTPRLGFPGCGIPRPGRRAPLSLYQSSPLDGPARFPSGRTGASAGRAGPA